MQKHLDDARQADVSLPSLSLRLCSRRRICKDYYQH